MSDTNNQRTNNEPEAKTASVIYEVPGRDLGKKSAEAGQSRGHGNRIVAPVSVAKEIIQKRQKNAGRVSEQEVDGIESEEAER